MTVPGTPTTRHPRRRFLGFSSAGAAAVLLGTGAWQADPAHARPIRSNPFTLGVASGDPTATGVVLWTRLAPDPYAADGFGGMERRPVPVQYEVSADENFRTRIARGSVVASPELAHSIHPEIKGLKPGRHYWYRFRVDGHLSPVGRTKTAPAMDSTPSQLRFGFASCQAWQDGFYTAYDHLAEEDLDVVLHLGDYLYESPLATNKRGVTLPSQFHTETVELFRYRLQYALYKSEAPLMKAHAAFPWIQTIDDHEVENNWAGDISQIDNEPDQDPVIFRKRRAAAFQAMYEHMPLRHDQLPSGPDVKLHRRLSYGRMADITMIDTRLYRDDQPCGDGTSINCPERFDTDRTILGKPQRDWLIDGFNSSPGRWHILGNQAPMGQTDRNASPDITEVWLDPWDGYVADRNRVLSAARQSGVENLVVVTGDRHTNYALDLLEDYSDPSSAVVGSEFVGTSICTGSDGADFPEQGRIFMAANPHLKFFNQQRGYCRVTMTEQSLITDFRVLPYVLRPGAPVSTRASIAVESGRPGVVTA